MDEKERVLFVCEDGARAQMAELLLRHHASEQFEVFSAAIWPLEVDPRMPPALRKFGVDDSSLQSRTIESFTCQQFDVVVTLCELAEAEHHVLPAARVFLSWHFRNPREEEEKHAGAFARCLQEINERIKMLLLILEKPGMVLPDHPIPSHGAANARIESGLRP